jgi:hypothetical protein
MEKYIISILIIISCLACQEDFLDEEAVTILTQNFYKTPEGLETLVNGAYQVFRFKTDYNHGHYLFGAANDCEVFLHNNEDRVSMGLYLPDAWGADVPSSETRMTPSVITLLGEYSGGSVQVIEGMYPVINRCNIFLENFSEFSGEQKDEFAERKGEILYIRAYSYYLLTNVLGDVPLILKSFAGMPPNLYFPKSSMEDIYKVMISDLREAVELLPETTDDMGRVTKPAAAHLLAKIYLNRAQAAEFENSFEQHLAMLFKGNVLTDLDSCIYYSTLVIDKKKDETEFGGLAPDYADLWEVAGYVSGNTNYARDLVSEIILSTQYTFFQEYNGRYGCGFIHIYDQDYTVLNAGVSRDYQDYPRPFRAIGPNDWAYDMYTDRANDSRFWKTYIHEYASNNEALANRAIQWNDQTAYYYNTYLKDKYPDRYNGDSATAGESKIEYQKRALVYIENSKDEPIDSLWVASQPYLLLARWMACSPDGEGYVTRDGSGNITGFRPGAAVTPDNPLVTDVSNREVIYRHCVDPGFPRYGSDVNSNASLAFMSLAKYWDLNRGEGTDNKGGGSIDIPQIRLAETYLIRAEAYGRKGNYAAAIADINILRKRAAFHSGEERSELLVTMEPGVLTGRLDIPADEKVAPYAVNTDSYSKIEVTGEEWQAGTDKAKKENYPPTVINHPTSDPVLNRFIHFIYNEKARELIYEEKITEDLHNAGILYDRVYYRDYFGAPVESTGTEDYPFPLDEYDVETYGTRGAIGHGRGQFDKHHTFKAWPTSFLDLLTNEDGKALSAAEKAQYQNYGY